MLWERDWNECSKMWLLCRQGPALLGCITWWSCWKRNPNWGEVPFAGRNEKNNPGKHFPFLTVDSLTGEYKLKPSSKYYFQIQGQMYIAKKKTCYFIVYTFRDLFIQKLEFDLEYYENSLLPKLEMFYDKFFKPYLSTILWFVCVPHFQSKSFYLGRSLFI